MKKWQRAVSVALGATMLLSTVATTAACNKIPEDGSSYDTENRPLVLAAQAFDGNFSPFFATSGPDSEIAGQTQLPLMTINSAMASVCGPNEATVALDWNTIYKDESGNVLDSATDAATTTYEFVIKNGIRYWDGTPLTVKDVMFNLYVYLDPMYAGSSTIYSTDIQGLKAYRAQNPDLSDDSEGSYNDEFIAEATSRIYNLTEYLKAKEALKPGLYTDQVAADLAKARELFHEEITSDWNECETSLTGYQEEYNFTEAWEVYFLNMGIISIRTRQNANGGIETIKIYEDPTDPKNSPFKYVTTLDKDPDDPTAVDPKDDPLSYYGLQKDATSDDKVAAWLAENKVDGVTYTEEDAVRELTKAWAIGIVEDTYTSTDAKLLEILTYWETAYNLRTFIENEARSAYYDSLPENERVTSISGITTYKTSNFNGKNKIALGDEHDVLSIVINGVDPKAVFNFSFGVAPMHYYSDAETIASTPYGVRTGNQNFFDNVLKKNSGLPKGAGVYMPSNASGNQSTVDRYSFYAANIVYFERNPYFYTVGLDGAGVTKADIENKIANVGNDTSKEIHNAKIKYLNYKVVGDDRILQNLQAQNIDYGQPNAEPKNVQEVANTAHLGYKTINTNGYGYVGVNPKFVPDLEVRQAIMKAMNTALTVQFYGNNAEQIFRPISNEMWNGAFRVSSLPEDLKFTTDHAEIEALVESAGWYKNSDGIYEKNGKKLELKFTIAGESKNHPAYGMFDSAAKFLNECGFVVTVGTDIQALSKLATGGLQVWAAAWSTGVDPDPYQTYHKDSTATSVKNWNYPEILDTNKTEFWREREIVYAISELIDQGRKTLDEGTRIGIYTETLALIMDLAVELPTYQRKDLVAWNRNVIDENTMNINGATSTTGVLYKLWKVSYK